MRNIKDYQFKELLQGQLLIDSFKQVRNDLYLLLYCKLKPKSLFSLLDRVKHNLAQEKKTVVVSIAFECPETIAILVKNVKKYCDDALLIVADNSHTPKAKKQIKSICDHAAVLYIDLPSNKTKHANRSHGMAVQWCFENIIHVVKPTLFAFIDHDLIPAKSVSFKQSISKQPFYGVLWNSEKTKAWQLWAGYCVFDYNAISQYKFNFLYDFSNGLDTGGRNYQTLYQYFDKNTLCFSSNVTANFTFSSSTIGNKMQIIDDCWIHMGGAGHLGSFESRYAVFNQQMQALSVLQDWSVTSSGCFSKVETIRK